MDNTLDNISLSPRHPHMYNNVDMWLKSEHGLGPLRTKRKQVMIDKIIAYSNSYTVNKNAAVTLSRPPVDYSTGEELEVSSLWREGFRQVPGQKAYCNHDIVNITIENRRFKAIFNPNKIMLGDKMATLSHAQLVDSLNQVEQAILSCGIQVVFDDLKLSRVDLCKDIQTIHNFNRSPPALKLISPVYMPNEVPQIKKGSFQLANRSRQYNFYDKGAQSNQAERVPNRVRCEIRFMNKESVTNSLEISTLGDLKDPQVFTTLSQTYKDILEEDFFRSKKSKIKVEDFDSDVGLLRSLMEVRPNKAIDDFLYYKLLTGKQPFSLEDVVSLMKECSSGRTTIYNRRKLGQELLKLTPSNESTGRISFSVLLQELRDKLTS